MVHGLLRRKALRDLLVLAVADPAQRQVQLEARPRVEGSLFLSPRGQLPFKAHCTTGCPHHAVANQATASPRDSRAFTAPDPVLPVVSKKAAFAEQFVEAMKVAHLEVGQGQGHEAAAALLNERGLKTRTRREWTATNLRSELRKRGVGGLAQGDPK
jgi:hypothetical protein